MANNTWNDMKKTNIASKSDGFYYFFCPYVNCQLLIQVPVDQVNCQIFRHGMYISNAEQMNPHTPEPECDRIREKKDTVIYGCGLPFRMVCIDNKKTYHVEICDYI